MSLNFPGSDADLSAQPPVAQGYWVRLTGQIDRLQASVDDVLAVTQASASQVTALLRHLTDPARSQDLDERLAGLLAGQEAEQERWQALANSLNDLGQTVVKLNRTQFKANALAEMKDQQVATALGTLQDVAARREQVQEDRARHEQERVAALRAEARGEFAADLLPALDGLELALDSGRATLARRREQEAETARLARAQGASAAPAPARPGLWQRLTWALWGRGLPPGSGVPSAPPPASPHRDETSAAVEAWLQGLELVRMRFLALLATADIHPIQAEGQLFDPRLHLALGTESHRSAPDGTVVGVLRKGYRQRGRVLRYAEVVVNRTADFESAGPTGDAPGHTALTQSLLRQEDRLSGEDRSEDSEP